MGGGGGGGAGGDHDDNHDHDHDHDNIGRDFFQLRKNTCVDFESAWIVLRSVHDA